MEATIRGSSKAFREISFLAATWFKETHHSLQKQEVRLQKVEQDARDQGREVHANAMDISCVQMSQRLYRVKLEELEKCMQTSQRLHKERLEKLEGLIYRQEQVQDATSSKLKEVRDIGKELRTQTRRLEEWELICQATDGPIAGAGGQRVSVSVPSTLETVTGPLEASLGGVTSADEVKRS